MSNNLHLTDEFFLTLYIYPSPCGVNWKTPHHLTYSVVKNALTFRPRSIGHVTVELKRVMKGAGNHQRDQIVEFTGMAAQNNNDNRKMVLFEHLGLGALFESVPGKLESREKLDPELKKRLKSGYFSFIEYKVSHQAFDRAHAYIREFREKGKDQLYGLVNRPRYSEGAGCSAFIASVLEVAGLMDPVFRAACSKQLHIPHHFIGELHPDGKKVPVWKLLFPSTKNLKWPDHPDHGREIFFWDPDMMHGFVSRLVLGESDDSKVFFDGAYKIVSREATRGVAVNVEHLTVDLDSFFFE